MGYMIIFHFVFLDSNANVIPQSSFPVHYGLGIERRGSTSDVTSSNLDQGGTLVGQNTYPQPGQVSKQRTVLESQRYLTKIVNDEYDYDNYDND